MKFTLEKETKVTYWFRLEERFNLVDHNCRPLFSISMVQIDCSIDGNERYSTVRFHGQRFNDAGTKIDKRRRRTDWADGLVTKEVFPELIQMLRENMCKGDFDHTMETAIRFYDYEAVTAQYQREARELAEKAMQKSKQSAN